MHILPYKIFMIIHRKYPSYYFSFTKFMVKMISDFFFFFSGEMVSALRLGSLVLVAFLVGREAAGAATGPVEPEPSVNAVLTEEEMEAALSGRGGRGTAASAAGEAGPSRGSSVVLAEIARELIGRSATSSQVNSSRDIK